MVPCYVFQVSLWVTVQNQIRIAQRVIVDKIIQLRPLRHGHIQCILDPDAVDGTFAIEGMTISKDTRSNLDRIGSGQASYQQVVNELRAKYAKKG